MLGQINEWFFHDLVGIQPDPTAPGFGKIVIKPAIVGDLTWVKATYDSVTGRISSEWKREGRRLDLNLVIPANTTATVYLPAADSGSVTESGISANKAPGVKFLRMESTTAVFSTGSGAYAFQSRLP
jgi:hypothetical protein